MASDQSLALETKTTLRLSAQQLRFVRLLEYNAPELEEAVEVELEENPALEIVYDENPSSPSENSFKTFGIKETHEPAPDFSPPDAEETLRDVLLRQLAEKKLKENVRHAASYIIGNLDSNGYLQRPLPGIVNDIAFNADEELTLKDAEEALEVVQDMEPYGIACSNLQECLLIQLKHLPPSQKRDDAINIVRNHFGALTMKHTHKIITRLKIPADRVNRAIQLIVSLNPKPGAAFSGYSDRSNIIVPDAAVTLDDGELSIILPNNIPELMIDRSFAEAVAEMEGIEKKKRSKEAEFIFSRYNDARDFIKVLKQRQQTLLAVVTAIVKIQHEYFLTQDLYKLKPMMIKDISALTGLDFSVVSRATNNKYLSTPWGVFPLRFFFSDSIGDDNEDNPADVLTNRKIEAEIADIVDKEDKAHPLSDEKIRQEMEKRGYEVSRRTVAKYRDRTRIPVARLRKKI